MSAEYEKSKSDENNDREKLSDENGKERRKFTNKVFIPRESLLTDLFQINHIQTIYNIFMAMLMILFLSIVVHDYVEKVEMNFGLKTIKYSFGKFPDAVRLWIFMTISTFITYAGFSFWSQLHVNSSQKLFSKIIVDYVFLLIFVLHQVLFIFLPAKFIAEEKFPPASSLMILMEQARMLMKTHAFVRSNAPRVLKQSSTIDKNLKLFPDFSKFLYFMFAPTLIYRDEYPRTKSIRWRKVLWSFTEVVLLIFYAAFIFERFVIPPFEKNGLQIFEPKVTIVTSFNLMLPAQVISMFGFYCILHSWQNAMAELLRFADKLFYKDWWNCGSYDEFYRTWNIIVQDWLYNYVYRDVYDLTHSRVTSIISVFAISAAFHEYIMAFALRFFYPVMMLLFGFSVMLLFTAKNYPKLSSNLFIWFGLFTGNGILITLYSMEYYARLHCPAYDDRVLDLFLPRSWICRDSQV